MNLFSCKGAPYTDPRDGRNVHQASDGVKVFVERQRGEDYRSEAPVLVLVNWVGAAPQAHVNICCFWAVVEPGHHPGWERGFTSSPLLAGERNLPPCRLCSESRSDLL